MPDARTLSVAVTGGASGIGAATVRRVLAAGGQAGIVDRDAATAAFERPVPAEAADVRDAERMKAAAGALARAMPPLSGLVVCAGIGQRPLPIADLPVEEWQQVLDVHLRGAYLACQAFGPLLAKDAAVVLVSSVLALRPGPVLAYGPAKAAIANLAMALAVEWAPRGIRVNAVAPGWTDTPLIRAREKEGRSLDDVRKAIPAGRLLRAEEIAEVIFFLLTSASSAVSGSVIVADGGFSAANGWAAYGPIPQRANPGA